MRDRNVPEGVQNIEYKPLHTNIPTGHQILLQQFGRVTHGKHQVLISPSMTLASTAAMKDDGDLPSDCDLHLLHADPLDQPRAPGVPIVNQNPSLLMV